MIVDLGCGDAALARRLIPKGYTVLSYDLVAGTPFVVATDICSKLPLPGSEGSSDEGHIVDVVVCSLSLMSTNWVNCIREAARVLKTGFVFFLVIWRANVLYANLVFFLGANSRLQKSQAVSRVLTNSRPWLARSDSG